ncbi:probable proteasome inhibitor isoform X2 [Phalaenopsis equestris]|uniref:probable proteasome inhibitor isoform X2 n=1 Tax=Phalaenopsis equestris TaxID=78828 RepID=UPI0009E3E9E1|nr:probable proteasome inhibitor isoform X2 [Phalaenopsis equestris]
MASENSVMAVIRASRPAFRNHHDRVAFAVHASVLSAGFSLIAVGRRALDSDPPIEGEEIGVEGWNELDDAYGFVYSKSEKDKKKVILVKCLPLEDYLMVDAVDLKSDQNEPFHMQINIKDYLAGSGAQQTTYGEMYKNLQGLVNSVNTCILEQVESKGKDTVSARSSRSASSFMPVLTGLRRAPTKEQQLVSLHITNQCLPVWFILLLHHMVAMISIRGQALVSFLKGVLAWVEACLLDLMILDFLVLVRNLEILVEYPVCHLVLGLIPMVHQMCLVLSRNDL